MKPLPFVLTLSAALVCGGCELLLGGTGGPPPDETAEEKQAREIGEYNAKEAELTSHRQSFLSKRYSYQQPVGNLLYFLDFPGFAPGLHRFEKAADRRVDYAFSIGAGDFWNYRANEALVVTAERAGDVVKYRAYDATQADALVEERAFEAPKDEQRWWAYAVDGSAAYLVTMEGTPQQTWLQRWTPATGAVEKLFTLEAATRQTRLGEFLDFDVDGDTVVFIEGGRLWRASLATQSATWLENDHEITGTIDFRADGVTYEAANGLFFFDVATKRTTDVGAQIKASTYRLNDTFAAIHHYVNDFSRWDDWLVYGAGYGIFAYDLRSGEVRPVLLEPRDADVRVTYRYPAVTSDGTMYVTGLESTSGSVGAEGPIWKYDLATVLQ